MAARWYKITHPNIGEAIVAAPALRVKQEAGWTVVGEVDAKGTPLDPVPATPKVKPAKARTATAVASDDAPATTDEQE